LAHHCIEEPKSLEEELGTWISEYEENFALLTWKGTFPLAYGEGREEDLGSVQFYFLRTVKESIYACAF
jgi:hypothetical protein